MFPVTKIRARELLGEHFPEDGRADFWIYGVSDLEEPEDHTIIFVKNQAEADVQEVRESIFLMQEKTELSLGPLCIGLKSKTPKNLYGELLNRMTEQMPKTELLLQDGSYLSADVKLGKRVKIGPFCVIGRDVVIGDDCEIGAGTIIRDHVRIGNRVQIKERCVVGAEDADIYRLEDGTCRTLPHLAGTVIEDGCLLLAGAILAAGDTRTTVLKKGSMIGMLGDVGHNCRIGEQTLISGKASISGHCQIGDHVYVAPMAVTTNRIGVGDQAYLGLGAVAIKDVPENEKQFGNPARKVLEKKKG